MTTTKKSDPPRLVVGETFETASGHTLTVSEKAHACLPRVRAHLVALARDGGTTTYGALVRDLGLPYPAVGVGRVLDTLAADCARRGEPGLDALVKSARTPPGEAVAAVHAHWGAASGSVSEVEATS
ncbi:hypothetical protein [Nocardioides sp. CFH 31398]|uniref:hypothetical protein n=1 Tax=Nocardioides sp. CFH 31398 TaxID=2919579 RepID=UPI001F053D34|nr:hypothetical protein [Nocardioides sp. CFH 31398]MCH1866167.1 hypothetical protein [Nocardioides sp. CFH 31398]